MNYTIPQDTLVEIEKCIPSIPTINDKVKILWTRDSVFNFYDLIKGKNFGISLVCLRDAYSRINCAKISFYNAYVQYIWYQKYVKASLEFQSIISSKYYLDYIPLLLYAAQEDIAEFILNFLGEVTNFQEWKKLQKTVNIFEKKQVISNAAKTGIYLKDKHPNHQLSNAICRLISSKSWARVINYRNAWVHKKPPTVKGLGLQHNRESRIRHEDGKRSFGLGDSSKPDYSIEELFNITRESLGAGVLLINELITIVDTRFYEIENEINFG